ncbi:MAG: hypothetical protein GX129_04355 [Clostridiales bacterium]|nr:hypothetical protein [Clostridiales bacterium]
MEKSYTYYMLGMNIISEIELPGIVSTSLDYDLKIIISKFNMDTEKGKDYKTFYTMNENEFLCDIRNVAKYKISGGSLIEIDPYDQADMELIIVYLLGTCMGVLLVQKEMIALHGSAIVINRQAIIITGQCGAGKTTLSTALRLKGYNILSDDISPVMLLDSGQVMSAPAFPRQRVCHDTAVKLGIDTNFLQRACSEDLKYNIDISAEFLEHPVELFGIIQVIPGDVEDVALTELTGFEKINLIKSNIYCKEFYYRMDFKPSYFKKIINLARKIHAFRLVRPIGEFTVEKQINLLVNVIE